MAQLENRSTQFVGDALISVETEDPFVGSLPCREFFLRCKSRPGMFDHTSAGRLSDLLRVVSRAGINNNDFVSPGHRFTGSTDMLRFVEGDNGGSDLQVGLKGYGSGDGQEDRS